MSLLLLLLLLQSIPGSMQCVMVVQSACTILLVLLATVVAWIKKDEQ